MHNENILTIRVCDTKRYTGPPPPSESTHLQSWNINFSENFSPTEVVQIEKIYKKCVVWIFRKIDLLKSYSGQNVSTLQLPQKVTASNNSWNTDFSKNFAHIEVIQIEKIDKKCVNEFSEKSIFKKVEISVFDPSSQKWTPKQNLT